MTDYATSLVSVIIPNYRHGQFLEKRIDSILNQTYPNIEVIILDDCSPDNSKEIIELYRNHPKIGSIVYNSENSGSTFRQWKKGVAIAKGDIVWIAESDDCADPQFIAKLLPLFNEDENIGLVYCDSNIVNENNEVTGKFSTLKNIFFYTKRWKHNYINNGIDEINNFLIKSTTINNTSAVLFKKELLLMAINDKLRYLGDVYAYLTILSTAKLAYVAEPLNYYRDHSANSTKVSETNGENVEEAFEVYNYLVNHVSLTKKALRKLGEELALKIFYLDRSGRQPEYYLKKIDNNNLKTHIRSYLKIIRLKEVVKSILPTR